MWYSTLCQEICHSYVEAAVKWISGQQRTTPEGEYGASESNIRLRD